MAEAGRSKPEQTVWQRVQVEIVPPAIIMLGDLALFTLGLLILAILFLFLLGLRKLNYPVRYIAILESLHFWGYFAVLTVLLLDLLLKVTAHAFRKR